MIQQAYVLRYYDINLSIHYIKKADTTINNASIIIISASRFMSGDAATLLFWCFLGRAAANAPAQPSPVAPSFPASSPKSRARSCSSHSKSTFHPLTRSRTWLGVCFLLSLLLLPYLLSALSQTPLATYTRCAFNNSSYPLLTTNPHPLAITRTSPVSAALIIPRSVEHLSVCQPLDQHNHHRRRRHHHRHCHHPPCDTSPNTAASARQTLYQPASPYRKRRSYKAFLSCPN
jgi:hypothetical protein